MNARTRVLRYTSAAALFVLASGCGGSEEAAAPDGLRLEFIADAEVPPTMSPTIALSGDSLACIVESYEHRVLCGDRAWRSVRSVGREGAGPGEFRVPTTLFGTATGAIGVWDAGLSRLSVVTPSGRLLQQRIFGEDGSGLAVTEGEYLWYTWDATGPRGGPSVHRVPLPVGDATPIALAAPPPTPSPEPPSMRAAAPAFDDEWVFWTGGAQLVRYTRDGELRGELTSPPRDPELPSDLDAELLNETIRAYFGRDATERQLRGFRAIPKAPYSRDRPLRSDGVGRLWAITTRDHVTRSHFDVFDRDGFIGSASVPDRVLGYDIRGDLLAALVLVPAADPGGVHGYRVRWYRIEGSGGG